MSRAITIVLAGLCVSGSTSAQKAVPYTYQGDTLGVTTFQQFTDHLTPKEYGVIPAAGCFTPTNATRTCVLLRGFETTYRFVDDKLSSVTFAFNDDLYLSGYLDGLTEKFGPPVQTVATYQNGLGASFTGRVWKWKNSFGGIVLEELGENREVGTLYYFDTKLAAEFKERVKVKPTL